MTVSTPISSTLERFLELPEFEPALEYFGGRIIQKMSPMLPHCVIQQELGSALNAYARPRKLGGAYPELRSVFGGVALVPDLSFYAAERLPRYVRGEDPKVSRDPPDIIVEILSTGQTVGELTTRIRHAREHGARLGWLIDAKKETILVDRPDQDPMLLTAGDLLDGEPVLPGFVLPVAELFGWLDQE